MLWRPATTTPIDVTTSVDTTAEVTMHGFGACRIHNPSESSVTLTVYERTAKGGAVVACADVGSVVLAAGTSRALPAELLAAYSLLLVGDVAATLSVVVKP